MRLAFYWYPKCSTCQKAKNWLDEHNLDYKCFNLIHETPSKEELIDYMNKSELSPKKFFNTNGKKYRELNLKEEIDHMTIEEMADWLSSDGMLIKRPIITDGDKVTIGFNENTFLRTWNQIN